MNYTIKKRVTPIITLKVSWLVDVCWTSARTCCYSQGGDDKPHRGFRRSQICLQNASKSKRKIRLGQVFWILLNQLEHTLIRNSSWIEDSWTPGHFLDIVVKLVTKDLHSLISDFNLGNSSSANSNPIV